jgi:hypothetical protein
LATEPIKYAFAKVIKTKAKTAQEKTSLVSALLNQMFQTGMHFGKKTCQVKMRDFICRRENRCLDNLHSFRGYTVARPPSYNRSPIAGEQLQVTVPPRKAQALPWVLSKLALPSKSGPADTVLPFRCAIPMLRGLPSRSPITEKKQSGKLRSGTVPLLSGKKRHTPGPFVQVPKHSPVIQKGHYLLNLLKTRQCLNKATFALAKYAVKGRTFLFVGTKKPAANLISRAALFSQKSFFVNTRWLGGMLTNWKTILKSISKIRPILKEKQRIISALLLKRQEIKLRLINKILTAMKFIQKGRQFLDASLKTDGLGSALFERNNATRAFFLCAERKRTQLITQNRQLLLKRNQILKKLSDLEMVADSLKQHSLKGYGLSCASTQAGLLSS